MGSPPLTKLRIFLHHGRYLSNRLKGKDFLEELLKVFMIWWVADAGMVITRCCVASRLLLLQSGEFLSDMERFLMSDYIKVIGKYIIIQVLLKMR